MLRRPLSFPPKPTLPLKMSPIHPLPKCHCIVLRNNISLENIVPSKVKSDCVSLTANYGSAYTLELDLTVSAQIYFVGNSIAVTFPTDTCAIQITVIIVEAFVACNGDFGFDYHSRPNLPFTVDIQ